MQNIEWSRANAMTDGTTIYCRECVVKQAESYDEKLEDYLDGASRGGFASVLIVEQFICHDCKNN